MDTIHYPAKGDRVLHAVYGFGTVTLSMLTVCAVAFDIEPSRPIGVDPKSLTRIETGEQLTLWT